MKKLYIVTIPLLVIGATVGAIVMQPKQEDVKTATSVVKTQDTIKETSALTTPEATQPTETVETTIEPSTKETVVVAEVDTPYTLETAREYFIKTYPNIEVYFFDKYFADRPWVIQSQTKRDAFDNLFIDHIVSSTLKFEQARYDNAKK